MTEFDDWTKKNEEYMKLNNMSKELMRKKLAMLLLCEMYAGKTEGKLTYKSISKSLNLPELEVEVFLQESMDYGIIDVKMDQLDETVVIMYLLL